jgi:hypothetical protein
MVLLEYSITVGFVKGYFVVTYPLAPSLIYYVKGRRVSKGGGQSPPLKITSPFPSRGRGIKGDGVT